MGNGSVSEDARVGDSAVLFGGLGAEFSVISLVANAEGENPVIAPNTWVEVKGTHLASSGDSRVWQGSDFHNNQLPL